MTQNWTLEGLKGQTLTAESFQAADNQRKDVVSGQVSGKTGRKLKSGELEVADENLVEYRKRIGFVMVSKTQYFSTWDNVSYYTAFHNPATDELGTAESRVLQYLCKQSFWYNWQLYQRTVICDALGLNPSTVTRAIAKLTSLGLIKMQSAKTGQPETPLGDCVAWFDSDLTRASYRELVWSEWKALANVEVLPNRASWLRISNSVMWKGQPMYMYKPAEGIVIENRSGVYRELQGMYGQEPGVMFALQDDVRKGRVMAGYWDSVVRRGCRVLPEGRW